jgi:glycosyltransferase involved in cell wall biosynthesis
MPQISIITINLNNKTGLEKTIPSVIEQNYSDFEYIIMDGGSTDGSLSIIETHQSHFSYWCSEPDKGIYQAMNKGILAAKGKYLLFLNSGDILDNAYVLEKISTHLTDPISIIFGNITYVRPNGIRELSRYPSKISAHFLSITTLPHPASFISRNTLLTLGLYDESYKIAADYAFFAIAILKYNVSYKYVNQNIACFATDGISSNPLNNGIITKERKKALRAAVTKHYFYYLHYTSCIYATYFRIWWKAYRVLVLKESV